MPNDILVVRENIAAKLWHIRGKKVLLDYDLAVLYGVPTKALKQAARRNLNRFPIDFMFQLSQKETDYLRSQIVTLKRGQHIKYKPYAFTELGVAMLSSVLHSERAIKVNIEIMRTFAEIREFLSTHKDLAEKLEELEQKYDGQFRVVFDAIKNMLQTRKKSKSIIGFRPNTQ
ncbi:MAG: ORF6N domain-containing protein [Candidatus Margulisiibacteriota bacterium]|jgi:hypothetical protein